MKNQRLWGRLVTQFSRLWMNPSRLVSTMPNHKPPQKPNNKTNAALAKITPHDSNKTFLRQAHTNTPTGSALSLSQRYDAIQAKINETGRMVALTDTLEQLVSDLESETPSAANYDKLTILHYQLGLINQNYQPDKARYHLEKSIEYDPNNRESTELLANIRISAKYRG